MAGWSREKRLRIEKGFYEFLGHCVVDSKDKGTILLGDNLYDGQVQFITETFDALERDVHKIFCLKSRQLGISTIARALIIFMIGLFDGVKGAIVYDTEPNKAESRNDLRDMIKGFPTDYKFPTIGDDNRTGLTLANRSRILFMSAGVRKTKSSGTLGRSVGISRAILSEICSYDNDEGLEAFDNSLSDENPDRLYIYESTARGPNRWKEMWEEARADTDHCHCIFLGWYAKPSQQIAFEDKDFDRYGSPPPTDEEIKNIALVKKLYNRDISVNQLAWIRRKMDPTAKQDGEGEVEFEGSATKVQEQPWTEEQSFQMTGSVFFPPDSLTFQVNKFVKKVSMANCYSFSAGIEFVDMRVYKARNPRSIELKVWEEPRANCTYVLSADVAYGSNEHNDRSSFHVLRCYADGMDQVAEYAWPLIGSKQYAWVILATAAWYASENSEVYLIIELNGPGRAVHDEIMFIRHHIARGYQPKEVMEKGLQDCFKNVKTYLYHRPDSLGGGHAMFWQTNQGAGPSGKVRLMERLRDFISTQKVHIVSLDTLLEMKDVTRDGDTIGSEGRKKDDRVVAMALGVRCFEDRVQKKLSGLRRTRENEQARMTLSLVDKARLLSQYQFQTFLDGKRRQRIAMARQQRRANWRYR